MARQFVVIERVNYIHRQDYGLRLLAVRNSQEEAKELVETLREFYKQNEHNQISFQYLEVDDNLLKERLEIFNK
ncbi:hypothetical protein I2494_16350 [Budviciaceae bacterium BWR-B9]|uniref:Uncharacterized protein n=2 Tax=Limnobaculum TaxID=2172100 RepID=A0A9D7AG62_9GAMM|nr:MULTISPECIES: hypothetical protein [Limnobaculum]MBK5072053.1 hypothetical protein [Limnobaculum xujianqingii]MBK5145258.1 hypothetical protein [Limnobaculum allomyrinae]MBK5175362.1 hypothetical protein [Limnobaculum xujianqingii]MBV7693090.1 hypothetical protein [Limnobaculum sp. M2-1]